ncbi:MAG: DUF6338 family protein [Phycisphaerales bacterium]
MLSIFFKLLPGFLAAAVFHALTPFPKRDILDRIVAAMIFTLFAELVLSGVKWILLFLGANVCSIGEWTKQSELAWSVVAGTVVGVSWSYIVNCGVVHAWLNRLRITKKTAIPSQWFSAFSTLERYVVLHLIDERRIMGWPREWPDDAESGHFQLMDARWLLDDGSEAPLPQIEVLLIAASRVETVEFLRKASDPEIERNRNAIIESREVLLRIPRGGNSDGKEGDAPKS